MQETSKKNLKKVLDKAQLTCYNKENKVKKPHRASQKASQKNLKKVLDKVSKM